MPLTSFYHYTSANIGVNVTGELPAQLPALPARSPQYGNPAIYVDNGYGNIKPVYVCFGPDRQTVAAVKKGPIAVQSGDIMLITGPDQSFAWVTVWPNPTSVYIDFGWTAGAPILFGTPLYANQKILGFQQ